MKNTAFWGSVILSLLLMGSCARPEKPRFDLGKIYPVAKMATAETVIEKVVLINKEKKLLRTIKLGESVMAIQTEATLWTGIDMTRMEAKDVVIEGTRISLQLPPVEVINFSYPIEKTKVVTEIESKLSEFTLEDWDNAFVSAEKQIKAQIPYMGLQESTERTVKILLLPLLTQMGFSEIFITFRPSTYNTKGINLSPNTTAQP